LGIISFHGSLEISTLAIDKFSGSRSIFIRFPPEWVLSAPQGRFPRGRIEDSIFSIISPKTKTYIKKYHHVMIGANLSEQACESLENLRRRELIEIKPIPFIAALYDGTLILNDGWLPTEVCLTTLAKKIYMKKLKQFMSHLLTPDVGFVGFMSGSL